jgi:hypothetical protein
VPLQHWPSRVHAWFVARHAMHVRLLPVAGVPHTSVPQQSASAAHDPLRSAHVTHVPSSELEHCVPAQHDEKRLQLWPRHAGVGAQVEPEQT